MWRDDLLVEVHALLVYKVRKASVNKCATAFKLSRGYRKAMKYLKCTTVPLPAEGARV